MAELLAQQAEREAGILSRAFRRAARSAFLWPENAVDLVAQNRPLIELRGIGPYEVPVPKSNQSQSGERNLCVMTNLQFKGSRNEVKGKLKQKYGQLTDDDLRFAEGKEQELLGRLHQKLGKSKEDLRTEIDRL